MAISLPLTWQTVEAANGNKTNLARPPNFFVAFPTGAHRARRHPAAAWGNMINRRVDSRGGMKRNCW